MAFVDIISLRLKAGDGGAGASSFRREKYVANGGPDGGDGGRGGSIIFQANARMHSLIDLKVSKNTYKASGGKQGMGKKKYGRSGEDLVIQIPSGTLIYDDNRRLIVDLDEDGMTFVLAKGGKGGLGNAHFSTSSNKAPTHFQTGLPGEEKTVHLELRLLAEAGLIGLPNAGKSSLLHALTQANPKIGDYPFTTLFPNLGTLKTLDREIILADIPGLIKGASNGQGLGHAFLRHIDRTSVLVHLVPADIDPERCFQDYQVIYDELLHSEHPLSEKPCILLLSKCDLVDTDTQEAIIAYFKSQSLSLLPISSFTNTGISSLIEAILKACS